MSKILKFDFLENKKSFWSEMKKKIFVSWLLSFRLKKQTSKNVADTTFKACFCYFLSNFYFSINDSLSKTMKKVFYFIWKALFILEIFNFLLLPSSPLFLPISHCSWGWSKINLKVYDIMNCLNKNLIAQFLWY